MDLIMLILAIALIGFFVYLITTKIPMPPYWAACIQVTVLIVIVFYLIRRFFNLPNVL